MTFSKLLCSSLLAGLLTTFAFCSQDNDDDNTVSVKEETVVYTDGGTNLKGFAAYDANRRGKLPVVVVVHEWWGLNEYPKKRARQLAEMGYLAFAADMYGDGKTGSTPAEAAALAAPFNGNPQLGKSRLDAALQKAKTFTRADTSKTAAIGYCFGGGIVLNAARLGTNTDGVVSFHGSLLGAPANKDLLKAAILVCHGTADSSVRENQVVQFKRSMDSIGANYTFREYAGATHAFTNPESTETGLRFNLPIRYHPAADTASWNEMKLFFGRIF